MYYNKKRLALSVFWVLLGAALFGLSVAEVLDKSLYAGMGGGLIAVGALQIARNLKYRKDAAYREKVDIEVNDERGKFLRMKSWSWAGYVILMADAVGAVIAMVTGQALLQQVFCYSVCLITFVYWISYLILSRKY